MVLHRPVESTSFTGALCRYYVSFAESARGPFALRENQFVLFQIDDHHFKFVQEIHTQQSVYVLAKTFGNFLHVHGEDSMIPPKYGPKFQRGLCEDTCARITRTLLSGDCIPQAGAGDINKPGTDGSVVRAGV